MLKSFVPVAADHCCIRMQNFGIPKILLYGKLAHGTRTQGGQYKRFKDNIKHHLQEGGTELARWEQTATDRSGLASSRQPNYSKNHSEAGATDA